MKLKQAFLLFLIIPSIIIGAGADDISTGLQEALLSYIRTDNFDGIQTCLDQPFFDPNDACKALSASLFKIASKYQPEKHHEPETVIRLARALTAFHLLELGVPVTIEHYPNDKHYQPTKPHEALKSMLTKWPANYPNRFAGNYFPEFHPIITALEYHDPNILYHDAEESQRFGLTPFNKKLTPDTNDDTIRSMLGETPIQTLTPASQKVQEFFNYLHIAPRYASLIHKSLSDTEIKDLHKDDDFRCFVDMTKAYEAIPGAKPQIMRDAIAVCDLVKGFTRWHSTNIPCNTQHCTHKELDSAYRISIKSLPRIDDRQRSKEAAACKAFNVLPANTQRRRIEEVGERLNMKNHDADAHAKPIPVTRPPLSLAPWPLDKSREKFAGGFGIEPAPKLPIGTGICNPLKPSTKNPFHLPNKRQNPH